MTYMFILKCALKLVEEIILSFENFCFWGCMLDVDSIIRYIRKCTSYLLPCNLHDQS